MLKVPKRERQLSISYINTSKRPKNQRHIPSSSKLGIIQLVLALSVYFDFVCIQTHPSTHLPI
jgi:hypothetical protein